MKSEIIQVDNLGNGFKKVEEITLQYAGFGNLNAHETLRLQLITEEMQNLVRMITGEISMSFWIEYEGGKYLLHLSTKTVMDKEKRALLLSSSSSET